MCRCFLWWWPRLWWCFTFSSWVNRGSSPSAHKCNVKAEVDDILFRFRRRSEFDCRLETILTLVSYVSWLFSEGEKKTSWKFPFHGIFVLRLANGIARRTDGRNLKTHSPKIILNFHVDKDLCIKSSSFILEHFKATEKKTATMTMKERKKNRESFFALPFLLSSRAFFSLSFPNVGKGQVLIERLYPCLWSDSIK